MKKTLIKNIGRLQTPEGSYPHKGEDQGRNRIAKNMDILVEGGIISAISPRGTISPEGVDILVDAEGCLVTPGLVDGHTHLVFGGYRQNEIPLKLAGADYLEILKAGGGILDTLNKTRRATFRELEEKSQGFLDEMMSLGVTTCEAKSGYGLDMETEMKMLKVIDQLSQSHPMDIVSTFMGAHMIPPEYKDRGDDYIDLLCREILPAVAESGLARFVDVFCEEGVFDPEQSRKYLQAANFFYRILKAPDHKRRLCTPKNKKTVVADVFFAHKIFFGGKVKTRVGIVVIDVGHRLPHKNASAAL